ncbi:hypothetical protein EDF78_108109 [Rahnella sp. BIGb0236]|nr:hypothetical protein EDF78_108109 [Rahnella sp. BIGb0236]
MLSRYEVIASGRLKKFPRGFRLICLEQHCSSQTSLKHPRAFYQPSLSVLRCFIVHFVLIFTRLHVPVLSFSLIGIRHLYGYHLGLNHLG